MSRFLALACDTDVPTELVAEAITRLASVVPPLEISRHGCLTVAASGGALIRFDRGVIAGALFDRRFPGLLRELPQDEWERIVSSRGMHLIDNYWGGYIALLQTPGDRIDVIRAPMGELPCYRGRIDRATLFASDIDLLRLAGAARTAIAWDAVAAELAWPNIRNAQTCIEGVAAVNSGERVTPVAGAVQQDQLWRPSDFAAPRPGLPTTDHVERIRRQVQACTGSRASAFERVQLLLSGGLDSSIIAACLARSDTPLDLLTLFTRDPVGDERDYGRRMARAVGLPLEEMRREIVHLDPRISAAARLPRPAARLFEQETARLARAAASRNGAQAIFTGGGGDNVFCALQSAAPATDRLLVQGMGRGFLETAGQISRLAPASLPKVLSAAGMRTLPWRRDSPIRPDLSFLSAEARARAGPRPPSHPWLKPGQVALPGKAAHVKLVALADGFAQGFDPQGELPTIAPLLAQPVVETCLAAPSWLWFEDGRNRALARRAFARELPPEIAGRRSKGTPECFIGEIFEHHHALLREMLLDGILARRGFLDREAVALAFHGAGRMASPHAVALLRLVDVEAWLMARSAADG